MSDTGDIKQKIESAFQELVKSHGEAFNGTFDWHDNPSQPELSVTYIPPLNASATDYEKPVKSLFDSLSGFMQQDWDTDKDRGVYDVTLDTAHQLTLYISREHLDGALGLLLCERDYKWIDDFKERVNADILKLLQSNVPPERILAVVERLKQNWNEIARGENPPPDKNFFFESDPDEALAHPTAETRLKQFELAFNARAASLFASMDDQSRLTEGIGEIRGDLNSAINYPQNGMSVLAAYTAKNHTPTDGSDQGGGRPR